MWPEFLHFRLIMVEIEYCMLLKDLLSLAKSNHSMPLILVSRGCEVIRIPKLHLQTIPSPKYFRSIMDKARSTPGYVHAYIYIKIQTMREKTSKLQQIVCILGIFIEWTWFDEM